MPSSPDSTAAAPQPAEGSLVGKRVQKYEIVRTIGRGGMGTVYEAINTAIGKRVAMKFVDADLAQNKDAVARFHREAQAASAVESAHIVEIFDSGFADDIPFLVMELLRGEDLAHRIRRCGRLDLGEALHVIAQILRGLHRAHEAGIVHRDLKPDNIFLVDRDDDPNFAKILDFGISKVPRASGVSAHTLTRQGTVLGTPFYMSPEQAQGLLTLDHRADVWSLAAIAFECVTGKVPFHAPTGPMILVAILGKEPLPPSEAGKAYGVPASLDPVMEEAFMKSPEARLPSVGLLADRVGHAYGLAGSHRDWATMPQKALAERIRAAMPGVLARQQHATASASAVPPGPAVRAVPAASAAPTPGASEAFAEDIVMGVPPRLPRWVVPAAASAAVLLCALVALLLTR